MNKAIWKYEDIKDLYHLTQKQKTVLVGGCYDLLHYGHFTFLKNAKEKGEVLIVALESDEHIKKYKQRDPIHTQLERAEILANLNIVDYIILLPLMSSDKEYFELVQTIRPSVIAITADDNLVDVKSQQAVEVGATLEVVTPRLANYSTTSILHHLIKTT